MLSDTNTPTNPTRACTRCKQVKPYTDFYLCAKGKNGHLSYCKECSARLHGYVYKPPRPLPPEGYKYCGKCNTEKPLADFWQRRDTKDGLQPNCKDCCKAYKEGTREHIKERSREYLRLWYHRNPNKASEYNRTFRMRHPERSRSQTKKWRAENPERVKNSVSAKNARRRGAPGTYSHKDIERQLKAQHNCCHYCKAKLDDTYEVDHVVPLSRSGTNNPDNLVCACAQCNRSKGGKLPHEWPEGGRLC